jgi:hypothetical protein
LASANCPVSQGAVAQPDEHVRLFTCLGGRAQPVEAPHQQGLDQAVLAA